MLQWKQSYVKLHEKEFQGPSWEETRSGNWGMVYLSQMIQWDTHLPDQAYLSSSTSCTNTFPPFVSQTSWIVNSSGSWETSLWTKLVDVMEFQLSYFKSWEMMLWKCCPQYASKSGKLSSGHRTGKGQFDFSPKEEQCQRMFRLQHQFNSVQLLSCVWLFATPWITACQASLSIISARSLLKFMSIESVMPSSHLILCHPLLLLPPIPPSIRVFSNESLFAWGGQRLQHSCTHLTC